MLPYAPPKYNEDGFTCPVCNYYAHQVWHEVYGTPRNRSGSYGIKDLELTVCEKCGDYLVWHKKKMVFPEINGAPRPDIDMPEKIAEIYNEAKSIVSRSPRAAAALLRFAIETLVDDVVGHSKKSLFDNIGILTSEKRLPVEIQQSLDYLRVIGDGYLHPAVIDMKGKDNYETTISLFELLNFIVQALIGQPKKIKGYYKSLPQRQLDAIDNRNKKYDNQRENEEKLDSEQWDNREK